MACRAPQLHNRGSCTHGCASVCPVLLLVFMTIVDVCAQHRAGVAVRMVSTGLLVDTPVAHAPMHPSTEAFWRACAPAQDIKRLKTEGPRLNDLTVSHTVRRNPGGEGEGVRGDVQVDPGQRDRVGRRVRGGGAAVAGPAADELL